MKSPAVPSDARRIPELDGIRGIAILLVLTAHCFGYSMRGRSWHGYAETLRTFSRLGNAGVDLFFVLSGFLITGVLLDSLKDAHYFRSFYARRALRIFPLYSLTLLLVGVGYRDAGPFLFLSVLYLSNVCTLFGVPRLYAPLWSLSVEEHFYLLWPWVVSRLRQRHLWKLCLALIVLVPILRAAAYNSSEGVAVYFYSWFRFDELAWGALLAWYTRTSRYKRSHLFPLGCASMCAVAMLAAASPTSGGIGPALIYTDTSLLSAALICLTLSGDVPLLSAFTRSRPLVKFGELSYCLYLTNWLVFRAWDATIGRYPAFAVRVLGPLGALVSRDAVVLVLCLLLAQLSQSFFERPILNLKRRFAHIPSSTPAVGSSPA